MLDKMKAAVKKRLKSISGGELFYRTSPPPFGAKSQIFKRCDLCTIGVGTSVHFEEGRWVEFKHTFQKLYKFETEYVYKHKKRHVKLMVDKWCLEMLNKLQEEGKLAEHLEKSAKNFELD